MALGMSDSRTADCGLADWGLACKNRDSLLKRKRVEGKEERCSGYTRDNAFSKGSSVGIQLIIILPLALGWQCQAKSQVFPFQNPQVRHDYEVQDGWMAWMAGWNGLMYSCSRPRPGSPFGVLPNRHLAANLCLSTYHQPLPFS